MSVYLGQHEAALEQIGRALRLSPLDPENYRSEAFMAWALIFLGRYDEALKWARKALNHEPNWMQALRACAVANALAGNANEAGTTVLRICELDPVASISRLEQCFLRTAAGQRTIVEGLRLAGLPQ